MANYLCIHAVPDSHIEFIRRHPETLDDYLEGELPNLDETPIQEPPKQSFWQRLLAAKPAPAVAKTTSESIPSNWPSEESEPIGPEVNHRNVDLYHLLLNGTKDPVQGSGSIFQTWITETHSAIIIGEDNFAFTSQQVPELVGLLRKVDVSAATRWLHDSGERDYAPDDEECESFVEELHEFASAAEVAMKKSCGLVWISA